MMEIVLTEKMNAEEVRAKLDEQLPAGMRLTEVEDLPVKYLNGRYMVRFPFAARVFPARRPKRRPPRRSSSRGNDDTLFN